MIRTAIVGAGHIGRVHAEAIGSLSEMCVATVFDPDRAAAEAVAELAGATVSTTLDEALSQVDAVHILSPPSVHAEAAVASLAAGKAVFCEKPMAVGRADAEKIANAAERFGGIFMTGFNMRFRPAFVRLREIVQSGALGPLIGYFCSRLGPGAGLGGRSYWQSWRTQPGLSCGMTMESLSHDIDMIQALLGPVADVSASLRGSMGELPEFDNTANVVMNLVGGATASIQASWASHLGSSRRTVVGYEGAAAIEGNDTWDFRRVSMKSSEMEHERSERFDDRLDVTSYAAENKHFAECLASGEEPSTTARDGLRTVVVAEAILEANARGTIVTVERI